MRPHNIKLTEEERDEYVRTLSQCGNHALANRAHGVSRSSVGRAKMIYPNFRERCERAVQSFNESIINRRAYK